MSCRFNYICETVFTLRHYWPVGLACNRYSHFVVVDQVDFTVSIVDCRMWFDDLCFALLRIQSLKGLPWNPGVSQYIAIPATITARDFFLAEFYPSCPFTCIFFQKLSRFFLCWLWLTHGSYVGPQNEIGHPAGIRFPCWVPAEYKYSQKNMTCGIMTCGMNNLEIECSVCSALM